MEKTSWNPGSLLQMSGSYWQTCTLHTGVKLDLFTLIGEKKLTGTNIASLLKMEKRGVTLLLNGLSAMGLLEKAENDYSNTRESAQFLSKTSDQYIGYIILHHHHLAESWVNMDQALEQGGPIRHAAKDPDETVRESFLMGMFNIAMATAPGLAKDLDLSRCRRLLDLGGGPGTYAIQFCLAHPHLEAVVCDLPTTRPFAEKTIEKFSMSDRVSFVAGDYTQNNFFLDQKFDAAWLSHILHGEGPEMAAKVIKRAVESLKPEGQIFIHEFILDDRGDSPLFPALFSMNMFLGTPSGQSYTENELREMLGAQGIGDIQRLEFKGPTESGILFGRKG